MTQQWTWMGVALLIAALAVAWGLQSWRIGRSQPGRRHGARRCAGVVIAAPQHPGCAKPPWVAREVLALDEALNGSIGFGQQRNAGCRKIAAVFNAVHRIDGVSVGKSYVATLIARHRLQALDQQQALKHTVPPLLARNRIWAIDATTLQTPNGNTLALGLIDHGSRVLTALRTVTACNAWTALGVLSIGIGLWGKPGRVRTDNAAVFHSKVWRIGLSLLGIQRQFTQPGSPWQNGRIERLFGTLKERWRELAQPLRHDTQTRLHEFSHWYNACRPHQHLHGRTPLQAWRDEDGPLIRWRLHQWWGGALRAVVQRE